jgi:hypothetical protein
MDISGAYQLKLLLCFSTAILTALSCNNVHEEEISILEPVDEIVTGAFSNIDSLYLAGEFLTVRDSLLLVLSKDSTLQDEVLFRMLGLYHGRAMEDEFVNLLDNLELEGFGYLSGWKVSALDLAGTPEKALEYVSPGQLTLYSWLSWEIDSVETGIDIPDMSGPCDVFVLAHTVAPGSFSSDELIFLAEYEILFPSVRNVLLRELETSADTAGPWLMETLNSMTHTPERSFLLLEMQAMADSGSLSFWEEALETGCDEACSIAVEEILQRYPGEYSPRWDIVDCLVESDDIDLAIEYSSRGGPWHMAGADMAVLLKRKRYVELLQLIDSISDEAPDSVRARAALFGARALKGSENRGSVYYPAYLEFATEFPQCPQAREYAYNAGKYYDCEQEWNNAAEAYLTSLRTSGSWGGDERAHWRGGFSLYMAGRFIEADSLWTHACEEWPAGYWRDEMLFWRARLAGELGRETLSDSLLLVVAEEHPWEFYGILAADRLGIESSNGFAVPEIDLIADDACSLAVEMTIAGFGVPAVEMLSQGSFGSPSARVIALSLMGRHGSVLRMLRDLDTDLRESSNVILPDSLLCFYFPSPYRQLALEATDSLVLEADVLQGIMREESYFDRWVISRAGAMGVVQLMPGTACDVARWHGLPYLENDDFFDPAASLPYGALYIDRQQENFSGENPLFLAAYNAGPGNATRWVDMHGWNPADPELYIEQITYRETRMYVKKVQRSAWIYERR